MAVKDVAEYILRARGDMPAMKLQKLVYYSQVWSLVWDERPLFNEHIEAWANGPVCRSLYSAHHRQFIVSPRTIMQTDPNLDDTAKATIDAVLEFYGDKSAQWLSDLTHSERPWLDAREGLDPGERSERTITHASMAEYYGSL